MPIETCVNEQGEKEIAEVGSPRHRLLVVMRCEKMARRWAEIKTEWDKWLKGLVGGLG